jgi:hypothetical protein
MGTLGKFEDIGTVVADYAADVKATWQDKLDDKVEEESGKEGRVTATIERYTSALPSATWLVLGAGALIGSLTLKLLGREKTANFVGEWVPTFLLLGIYNKLVKLHGSDREM